LMSAIFATCLALSMYTESGTDKKPVPALT
jgi:hypothetical protein